MATTTNYGWTTPDDTALVKDGASAIRSLGSSVDSTVKNLNPETTLGDISYRSSTANTNTRLAIGTNGQVLTVSGGVPTWATAAGGGGLVKIATNTFTTASSTSFNNVFTSTYKNYKILFNATTASTGLTLYLRLRASSSDNTTTSYSTRGVTTGAATTTNDGVSYFYVGAMDSGEIHFFDIDLTAPQATEKTRMLGLVGENASSGPIGRFLFGNFNATTSFDGFSIVTSTGTITGTCTVYGFEN